MKNVFSGGAKRASDAQRREKTGEPGFYVINAFTGHVVAGPFAEQEVAAMQAQSLEPPTMRVMGVQR